MLSQILLFKSVWTLTKPILKGYFINFNIRNKIIQNPKQILKKKPFLIDIKWLKIIFVRI
jgi:hypothetical protein